MAVRTVELAVRGLGCSLVLLVIAFSATQASAQPALLVIDDTTPALEPGEDGWSGTLDLTNLTDTALRLSAAPADANDADCKPTLSKKAIGAAQSSSPELTVPNVCDPTQGTFEFILTAENDDKSKDIPVEAELQEGDDAPGWGHLGAFFIAVPVVALGLFLGFVGIAENTEPSTGLDNLKDAWSKDSWVSNFTFLGAFLTALFGSTEVVKAFLGEDPDRAIALAIVGSAIAAILIGAGAIIVNTWTKDEARPPVGEPPRRVFTVGGLLLATGVAVGGALGQLWVGWQVGMALEPDGWEDWNVAAATISWDALVTVGAVAALVLLISYTVMSTLTTIKAGTARAGAPLGEAVDGRGSARLGRLVEQAEQAPAGQPQPTIELSTEEAREILADQAALVPHPAAARPPSAMP